MEKLNLEKQQQASEVAVFERNYLDTAQFLDVLVHSSELVRVFARSKNQSKESLNKAVCCRYWQVLMWLICF